MRDMPMLEYPEKMCEYCCNFDKEHIGMDGMALCKLTMTLAYAEDYGGNCMFYNVPKEQIIVPPCKVGDTVYVITEKRPCYACRYCTDFCHKYCTFVDKTELLVKKATVYSVCFNESNDIIHIEIEESKDLIGYCLTYDFNDFGKTVFLTKQEAEKALAERSGK